MPIPALTVDDLYRHTDLSKLGFKTTKELEPVDTLIGQDRALEAVRFAARMRSRGYNLFVIGPKGSGKHAAVRGYLRDRAARFPAGDDWVYVNDFKDPHRPLALRLPPGEGPNLHRRIEKLIADLTASVAAVLEGEEYRGRREAIDQEFAKQGEQSLEGVAAAAKERDLLLVRTEQGFAVVPEDGGKPMAQEKFNALPQIRRERLQAAIQEVQALLRDALHKAPLLERDRQKAIRALNDSVARSLVDEEMTEVREGMTPTEELAAWLAALEEDLIEKIHVFAQPAEARQGQGSGSGQGSGPTDPAAAPDPQRRFRVNVFVSHEAEVGAPVVIEDHPTLGRLVGRIEYRAQMGSMLTDFTLIRPGALHCANGGYLLIDALKLLQQPFAWDALKRALYSGRVTIESPQDAATTTLAVSIQPADIPLSVKVVLFGDQRLYHTLAAADPDFADLFKVAADFDDIMERDDEHDALYARLIATIQKNETLRPFNRKAVERVIEHCSRLVADRDRVTTRVGLIADLMREADYQAREHNHKTVVEADVEAALEAYRRRSDRIERRMREQILAETMLIDTDGAEVGQVNGLSVLQIGTHSFGRPTRITARVRPGNGKVVDIEREVELGGPLHSKGMLILQGYLAATYATDVPASLQASVVFEQSYGGVDGDSASSTELYALLSALSEVPIRQGIAVTGSVNQMGDVQAIGGVNEKIEGFFDICAARGLTGDQGVMIPAANTRHLMLKEEVRDAVKAGKFKVWAVSTIAEGIEILTGVPAGPRGADGSYPDGTVNARVEARMRAFAETRRRFIEREV
ncbi:Lon protease family protein [Thalassobaculum litoreum]|uniref:endopeptidase La n=1 Tax=Thalassobaculum litoreum DSM 18839 TaxID=1123362 RepID=A0A8G2BHV0_9PROT|nr:AAA family ATPase [Thalassobaculum litoreum]SDF78256.1 lon-related putative ATP-dependent protease [Thalassobaculum litoreum DSM 18839]